MAKQPNVVGHSPTDKLFQSFQPIAAITTTPAGMIALQPLWQVGAVDLWVTETLLQERGVNAERVVERGTGQASIQTYSGSLKDHLTTLWQTHRSFVFCLATGAVVRLIAPLLQDKNTDPAVVVVDATKQYVISLCGGHQAKADALTRSIALQLGATPILTGGANGLHLPSVDMLGEPFGWQRGEGDWTGVSAVIAQQQSVQVIQEAGSKLWRQGLPKGHPFVVKQENQGSADTFQARLWISPLHRAFSLNAIDSIDSKDAKLPQAQWHPKVLWVGIGCERGTSRRLIETAIQQVCQTHQFAEGAIVGIATLDLKADEAGILELCHDRQWVLQCFTAEQLRLVPVPTPSSVVATEVGTPSVAEAAAILASQNHDSQNHDSQNHDSQNHANQNHASQHDSCTDTLDFANLSSINLSTLKVAKTIVRQTGEPGAVTVAIAQAERELIGRSGQLWLVGTGPGALNQMTPAAQTAINQADVVIGYTLYTEMVSALLRPGQIVEALPITQERQRAERAIELAQWGLTVAVISSGDCGIYGMAGLVLEQLQQQGWDGKTPDVQVFPGISALQAAASRVGAPLMHDFCAISLSDLLTPWEVIAQRLTAAAQADFVTALYNPRSQTRTSQIETAQQIFLAHRSPHTPVAIVRSVYRPDEQLILTTLGELLHHPIDMLTTLIIGNRSTQIHANKMITPRGYLGFGTAQKSMM